MRTCLIGLMLVLAASAEIKDLGVVSPRTAIQLDRNTVRPDFSHFELDLVSLTFSNRIQLVLTNELLTLSNLTALPSGRILMGLRGVCRDGSVGAVQLYRFDIRRAGPPKPTARLIQIVGGPDESVIGPLDVMAEVDRLPDAPASPPMPPMPHPRHQGWMGFSRSSPIPPAEAWPPLHLVRPLPGGTNESYAEHLDAMAEHYARPGRRNER